MTANDDPCGKTVGEGCYRDTLPANGGTNTCVGVDDCSFPSFFEPSDDTGACEAKQCTDRGRNSDEGVTLQCGPDISAGVKCYWDPRNSADGKCKTSCENGAHYQGNSSNVCVLRDCENRTHISSNTEPCGPVKDGKECYYDERSSRDGKCDESCTNPSQFEKNNDSHTCEPIPCNRRTTNGTIGSQCGPSSDNCYVNATTGVTCTDCPVSSHYNKSKEIDEQLVCTFITDCSKRVILEDNENDQCGKDLSPSCLLDIPVTQGGTGKCTSVCSLTNFTELTTDTGICVEKECTQRNHNDSAMWECGSGNCVWDPQVSGDHTCSEACIKKEHYEANASKVCVKKQCISRGNDGVTNNPCSVEGDACYYDPVDVTPCVVDCTATSHYSGIAENGVCQIKSCDSREYNALIIPPCGEDCIADTDREEETIAYHCGSKEPGCRNTDHFELVEGVCRPISDCRLRSPNNETEFLCGLGCVLDVVSGKCASTCPAFYDDDLEKGKCNVSFTCLTTVYANKNIITDHTSCGESPINACGTFDRAIERLCKNNAEVQNVINRIRLQPFDPSKFTFEKEEVLFDGIFDVSGTVILNIPTNIMFTANPTAVNAKLDVFKEQNTSFDIEEGNITFFNLIVLIPNLLSSPSSSPTPDTLIHVSADTSLNLKNVSFEAGVGSNYAGGDYSLVNNEGSFSLTGVNVNGTNTFFSKMLFITNPFFSLHSSNFNDIGGGPFTSIIDLFVNGAETGKTNTAITINLTNSSFRNISIGGSVIHSTLGISRLTYLLSGLSFINISTTSNGAVFFHNGSFSSDLSTSPHVHTVSIGTFEGSLPSTFIDVHVLKEANGVGGALALYGVETLTIGTGCLFRNCTAKTNGGAVFYSAISTQTTSSVEISAKFEDCSVTSPGCRNVGGAVAVYVWPRTNAVVSTDEAQFSYADAKQNPEPNADMNGMFYVGFTGSPCNE